MVTVINLCFYAHAHLTVPSNYGQKREGMMLIIMGGEVFSIRFPTEAIIHSASG